MNLIKSKMAKKNKSLMPYENQMPHREEIFTSDRFEILGIDLAEEQEFISDGMVGYDFLGRIEDNSRMLVEVYKQLAEMEEQSRSLTSAVDWLFDNFYIVEKQLREIRKDLPPKYYRELPILKTGEYAGFPRIYHIAVEVVAQSDCRLEMAVMKELISSYQKKKIF
jgi:cyclic beta-1,2-glucan synthetase